MRLTSKPLLCILLSKIRPITMGFEGVERGVGGITTVSFTNLNSCTAYMPFRTPCWRPRSFQRSGLWYVAIDCFWGEKSQLWFVNLTFKWRIATSGLLFRNDDDDGGDVIVIPGGHTNDWNGGASTEVYLALIYERSAVGGKIDHVSHLDLPHRLVNVFHFLRDADTKEHQVCPTKTTTAAMATARTRRELEKLLHVEVRAWRRRGYTVQRFAIAAGCKRFSTAIISKTMALLINATCLAA